MPTQGAQPGTATHPKVEAGPREDMLVPYAGGMDDPLEHPALWRNVAKDAVRYPDVPAVAGNVNPGDAEPNALNVFLFYSHPSTPDREQFALTYDRWSHRGSGEFVK
jgi:hypothetical protein